MWEIWSDDDSVVFVGDSHVVTLDLVDGQTESRVYPFDVGDGSIVHNRTQAAELARESGYRVAERKDS